MQQLYNLMKHLVSHWLTLLLGLLLGSYMTAHAQACYKPISGQGVKIGGLSGLTICVSRQCLGNYYTDLQNVTDNSLDTYANGGNLINALNYGGISVRDTASSYPAGYVAGFVLSKAGLADLTVFNNLTIATYRNGNATGDSKSVGSLISGTLLGAEKFYATFITTHEFDEVRLITSSLNASVLTDLRVYAAVAFPQDCNVDRNGICGDFINGIGTDVTYNGAFTCAACNLSDGARLVNGDKSDYALLTTPASAVASVSVGVIDTRNTYPAGNRAGFIIAPNNTNTLLNAAVLNSITVETYLFGTLQESKTVGGSGSGLLNAEVINGSGRTLKQKLGFITTQPFNEVRLRVNQTATANLGAIRLYGAFEEPSTCTDCATALNSAGTGKYNGTLQANEDCGTLGCSTIWTGAYGLGIQTLSAPDNVVSPSTSDYATFKSVVSTGGVRVTIKNDGTDFPAGTFVGFRISKGSVLIDAGLLNTITIRVYRDGDAKPVDVSSPTSLLGASVLSGSSNRTTVGFYPNQAFDRVQIEIGNIVSASLAGDYFIYDAFVIEDGDKDGVADCNDQCPSGSDVLDFDGDGSPDGCDPDNDNDGIPDTVEQGPDANNPRDTDGDGTPDYHDLDSDNDTLPDSVEKGPDGSNPVDTDGDGNANYRDTDSDNDGIPDRVEAGPNADTPRDTDGDGKADYIDTDSDGDGIPDSVERGPDGNNPLDTDSDGLPDYRDLDTDNDGILDTVEKGADGNNPVNNDNDDKPDYRDLDADNDGIDDVVEGAGTDADNNGIADGAPGATGIPASAGNGLTPPDTDGDGKPNYQDIDSDNDGFKDLNESGIPNPASLDANGDGMVDNTTDPDNDGIALPVDGLPATYGDANNPLLPDNDKDGKPDYTDNDSDGDGIPDSVEVGPNPNNPRDTDGDGLPDYHDLDSDDDGILDSVERGPDGNNPVNTDNDDKPDYRDLDADNDSLDDVIEGGGTDADNNGIADGTPGTTGIPASAGNGLTPPDTDGDSKPDYQDIDSDGDGIKDLYESGIANPASLDSNGDGAIDDTTDADNDGIMAPADGQTNTYGDANSPLRNTDGDTLPDCRDLDSDNDGLLDTVEKGADGNNPVNSDNDSLPDYRDLDADNDGINDVMECGGSDADGNGLADGAPGATGIPDSAGNGLTPRDMDGDSKPNYQDIDSDGDGIKDLYESGIANPASLDSNGDGVIDDTTDADNDGIPLPADGLPDVYGDAGNPALPDTDGDQAPDYLDAIIDLTPTISMPSRTFTGIGQTKNVTVNVANISVGTITGGTITLRVTKPSRYMTVALAGDAGTNWTLVDSGSFFTLTSKPGVTISGNNFSGIPLTLTLKAGATTGTGYLNANILENSGGESNSANNYESVLVNLSI